MSDMDQFEAFEEFVNSGDALFHYTKLSTAIEKILAEKRLRLSLLKDTNDPREYQFKLLGMTGWSLPPEARDLYDRCHPVLDRIVRFECRVLCFCTNAKGNIIQKNGGPLEDPIPSVSGWAKSRMWSQYGESQHGICLVFSRSSVQNEIEKFSDSIKWSHAAQVEYTTEERMPFHSLNIDGNSLVVEGVEPYCSKHVELNRNDLFFTKHVDYRDESEFRLVVHDPKNVVDYIDIGSSIRGIITGDRTPKVYFPLLESYSRDLNVEARQARWDRGKSHLLLLRKREET
jgi:hypothetical protein